MAGARVRLEQAYLPPGLQPDAAALDRLRQVLQSECGSKGLHVLYAVLVGSRVKGLSHAGSDYDVRVVYTTGGSAAAAAAAPPDNFGHSVGSTALGGGADIQGWSLQRFADHLCKSNAESIEALRSPIVLIDEGGFRASWAALAEQHVCLRGYAASMLGNAKSNNARFVEGAEVVAHSNYIYTVCPLLGFLLLVRDHRPPGWLYNERVCEAAGTPTPSHALHEQLMLCAYEKREGRASVRCARLPAVDAFLRYAFGVSQALKASIPEHALPQEGAEAYRGLVARYSRHSGSES